MPHFDLARLFLLSLFIPSEFYVLLGGLKLELYRVILAIGTLKYGYRVITSLHRTDVSDRLLLAVVALGIVTLLINHGPLGGLEKGGIFALESFGAYFIARFCVNDERKLVAFFRLFGGILLFFSLFALVECLTGRRLLHEFAQALTGHYVLPYGVQYQTDNYMRAGFVRAIGPFAHPILWGTISAVAVPVLFTIFLRRRSPVNFVLLGASVFATLSSLSSAPFLVMALYFMMAGYFKAKQLLGRTIFYFLYAGAGLLLLVHLLSNRGIVKLIIHHATFNPHTGTHRLLIIEHLTDDIMRSPLVGSGIGAPWSAPGWMGQSIDNFWYAIAFFHGIPFSLLLLSLMLWLIARIRIRLRPTQEDYLPFAVKVVLVSLLATGITVHFFEKLYPLLYFVLGMSAFLAQRQSVNRPRPVAKYVRSNA